MLRSVAAVAAGFIGMMLVVMAGTLAATMVFVPGGMTAMAADAPARPLPGSYLAANLLVSLAGAAVAGWVAARLAPSSPFAHVLVLAALLLIMTLASFSRGPAPGQPNWYPWVIGTIGMAGVAIGGMLVRR